ncbi:MAG TPA: hypothetical protein VHU84_00365, partial [Lacipirellulaceae bacterium]|nr:hypothetical protein [Lacipirellulaceae bacterium]
MRRSRDPPTMLQAAAIESLGRDLQRAPARSKIQAKHGGPRQCGCYSPQQTHVRYKQTPTNELTAPLNYCTCCINGTICGTREDRFRATYV